MERLTALSLRWPRLTLLIALAFAALGAWGGARAPVSAGAYAYIGADQVAGFVSQITVLQMGIEIGRAVLTTSLALACGFFGMMASNVQTLADIGWLSATAISAALLAELIVLPALLAVVAFRSPAHAGAPACTA